MAWLNATPKPPPGSKRAGSEGAEKPVSRLARMPKVDGEVPRPPSPDARIMGMLMEIGLHQSTGMGIAPLSWSEIRAWSEMTRTVPSPADVRLIRQLSIDYVGESHRAEDENAPPPWRAPVSQAEADTEETRLRMVLG